MTANSGNEQYSFNLTPVNRAVLVACGATVATTATPDAQAQEDFALEEIVVTARKRSENLQDVPISVQAFGAETIAKQGIRTLEDYARLVPSLTYSSWLPGNSILVFRGVTVTADAFGGTSSAAIFLNEIPLTSQGQNPEVASVDMERIEAVSGPQPTTYGASAQSGVLKFVTAKPDLGNYGGFVDISGTHMEEGNAGYDFQGAFNIPLIEDKLALRLVAKQERVGGFVDNIVGDSTQTHDYDPAFLSPPGQYAYPGGFGDPSNIGRVVRTNVDFAEDDVGDIDTTVLRGTLAWAPSDDWLVTGMINSQKMDVDGIATWEPGLGELQQIRYHDESKEDDWYVATLVVEGDLGFADFTSATGYMDRDIVYDLDASTYLHQFQGVGGVYYNSFDIAYFGTAYASTYTYAIPAYNGAISGWTPGPGPYTYYITELRDTRATMFNDYGVERFTQEFRLTSKADANQRFQWMVGGFYERVEGAGLFRAQLDDFGDTIAAPLLEARTGLQVRSPGTSWFGEYTDFREEYSIFGEVGFSFTDNLNLVVGARYFDSETDDTDLSLNADGLLAQTCLEDPAGDCILDASRITEDNRIGTAPARNSSTTSDTLPMARLTYSVNDDAMTYVSYSEGFRVGGTNIVRAQSTANETFGPDRVLNYEIGFKSTLWDGRVTLNMAAYHMVWEDMQLVAADPTIDFGWGQVTVNAGEAEIDGFETNFAIAATERLVIDGAFSYTSSEVTEGASIGDAVVISDGEQLPLAPRTKWSLGGEYTMPMGANDGFVRLNYAWTDEQTNATQGSTLLTSSTLLRGTITSMDSYGITNLVAGYGNETWRVQLGVTNLTDERAVTYIPTRWQDGRQYSVRPREYRLTYRYNW